VRKVRKVKSPVGISTQHIKEFYQRLNHKDYGITELVIIDPTGKKGIIATGFFDNEASFLKACQEYNGKYNIYAGRNPRPRWLPKVLENYLDIRYKQRASDKEIKFVTAFSLDIDPIRPKGTSSTEKQHQAAIEYALKVQQNIGGWVDDSGNGTYVWIPFADPIKITGENRESIKLKCKQWQNKIIADYKPEQYGLRIDGCFDFSRIKKVIGTLSVKGKIHRLSQFVLRSKPNNKVRDAILTLDVRQPKERVGRISTSGQLSPDFIRLLQINAVIKELWCNPDENNDTSMHDWKLGCACIEAGIVEPSEIAAILMRNPFGKFHRDRRYDYIETTVNKMVMECDGKNK